LLRASSSSLAPSAPVGPAGRDGTKRTMAFFCPYCGTRRPDNERSLEHPMSQAIGGSGWATRAVCADCNAWTGREIDQPFAGDVLVQACRHRYRVVDKQGRVPPAPRLKGETVPNGHPVLIELTADGPAITRLPHRIDATDDHERYVTEVDDGDRLLRVRVERLQKQLGPGYEVHGRVVDVGDADDEVSVVLSTSALLWPRMGAKLALAFGTEAFGQEWAQSVWADWLRGTLRGGDEPAPDARLRLRPLPDTLDEADPLRPLSDPPNHVVYLAGGERAILMVHMFGIWRYGVPLGVPAPLDAPAWVFDSANGKAAQTTLGELALTRRDWFAARWAAEAAKASGRPPPAS
jgi:hypothetical protein